MEIFSQILLEPLKFLDAIEDVIWNFPKSVNPLRDRYINYEPIDAYNVMYRSNLFTKSEFTYDLSPHYTVFSMKGMLDLQTKIDTLCKAEKRFCVYVCEPYTFLFGSIYKHIFLLDTDPGAVKLGHTNTAGLITSKDAKSLCMWLWKRLYEANVGDESKQTLSSIIFHTDHA